MKAIPFPSTGVVFVTFHSSNLILLSVVGLFLSFSTARAVIVVDDFFLGNDRTAFASNFTPKTDSKQESGLIPAAVLGGRRDFLAEYVGGDSASLGDFATEINSEFDVSLSSADFIIWNYGSGTDTGRAKMIWGGGGDLNRNFSGENSFLLDVKSSEIYKTGAYGGTVSMYIRVISSAGSNTVARTVSHKFGRTELTWPFSEFTGVDFTDVDRIELFMEETQGPNSFYQIIFDEFLALTTSQPSAGPRITSVRVAGTSLMMDGTNGVASASYALLTSTNAMLSLSQWTSVATNMPGVNGAFSISATNVVTPGATRQFYVLEVR